MALTFPLTNRHRMRDITREIDATRSNDSARWLYHRASFSAVRAEHKRRGLCMAFESSPHGVFSCVQVRLPWGHFCALHVAVFSSVN